MQLAFFFPPPLYHCWHKNHVQGKDIDLWFCWLRPKGWRNSLDCFGWKEVEEHGHHVYPIWIKPDSYKILHSNLKVLQWSACSLDIAWVLQNNLFKGKPVQPQPVMLRCACKCWRYSTFSQFIQRCQKTEVWADEMIDSVL